MVEAGLVQSISKKLKIGFSPAINNKLIILVGLPYSGKTTLAKKLTKYNYIHFWTTVIRKELQYDDEKMLNISEKIIYCLLKEKYNVVFDYLNHKRSIRNRFASLATNLNKKVQIVYLNTPQEVISKRVKKVLANDQQIVGRSKLSQEVVNIISSELEMPGKTEDPIILSN